MDSTTLPLSHITQPLLPSSSKLPIKRKTPDDPATAISAADYGGVGEPGSDPKNPPFKFHRIWTEPDEIRFLQGLLDGSSGNLFFPRDLNVFYTRFSNTMSQPYTKSQLSEKLRRLRKKFRVISSRLVKGLDMSLLSPHDRALYDLSKQLWHPDFADTSPFNTDKSKKSNLVGVKVSFLPNIPDPGQDRTNGYGSTRNEENVEVERADDENNDGDGKLSEVNVELDRGEMGDKRVEFSRLDGPVRVGVGFGIGDITAKVVMDVFDECLIDFRNGVVGERSNLDGFGNGVVGERSNLDGFRNGVVGERSNLGDFRNGVVGERSNNDGFGNGVVGERSNNDGFRNGVGERSNNDGFSNGVVGGRSNLGDFLKEASSDEFEERWKEQRVAELDVMARRMRLVLEHSLQSQ